MSWITNSSIIISFDHFRIYFVEATATSDTEKSNSESEEPSSPSSALSSDSNNSNVADQDNDKMFSALKDINNQLTEELNSISNMIEVAVTNLKKIHH